MIRQQLAELEQQIRIHKREAGKSKKIPAWLLTMKYERQDKLMELEQDVAKTLHQLGAVGDKSKAPSLTINVRAPRPAKAAPKDIEGVAETVGKIVGAVSES